MVQSYDGQLTFFDQEVQSFSRLLPDFLLPGPMAYMTASDSFVTTTAGLELVAYRYNNIAAANWESKQQQGENSVKQQRPRQAAGTCSLHGVACGTAQRSTGAMAVVCPAAAMLMCASNACLAMQVRVGLASAYMRTGKLCWASQRSTSKPAMCLLLLMAQVGLGRLAPWWQLELALLAVPNHAWALPANQKLTDRLTVVFCCRHTDSTQHPGAVRAHLLHPGSVWPHFGAAEVGPPPLLLLALPCSSQHS